MDRVFAQLAKQPETMCLVSYENFTQEPEDEFRKICDFLGVPFEEDALKEENPNLSKWKPDPHLFGPIVSRTKKWELYVSIEDAQHIEGELETTMRKLNYQRFTSKV